MSDFKFTRTTTDTLKIKGVLSDDGTNITYVRGKKGKEEEITENIVDYLKEYAGEMVTLCISTKDEMNLLVED